MATTGLPALLPEPVWFDPLRQPSWLLPPIRGGARRVLIVPGEGASLLGLALFLGEALRFSTDARVEVATGDWVVTAGSAAVVRVRAPEDPSSGAVVEFGDASGTVEGRLAVLAGDGAALASLPGRVAEGLHPRGIRAAWSTAFQAPSADHAVTYARSHEVVARLRAAAPDARGEPDLHPLLAHLALASASHASPLEVAAFFAGLAAAKDAGSHAWGEYRLQANAIAQRATDPRDPVFRLSVAALALYGDTGEASARAHRLTGEATDELRAWLARIGAIG